MKKDETERVCLSCGSNKPLDAYGAYLASGGKTHHAKTCLECIARPIIRVEHRVYRRNMFGEEYGTVTISEPGKPDKSFPFGGNT